MTSLALVAASGLLNLLVILIIAVLIAGVVYWVLSLIPGIPRFIPPLAAALIVVVALIDALGSL